MKIIPLTNQERANASAAGFTHSLTLDYTDLTMSTVTTGQTFTFTAVFKANDLVLGAGYNLITPFQDSRDAASIVTSFTFGYDGATTAFLGATEMNLNGTEVYQKYSMLAGSPVTMTATHDLVLTIAAPTSGKALSNINTGRAIFYLALFRPHAVALLV